MSKQAKRQMAGSGEALPAGVVGEEIIGTSISGSGDACAQVTVPPGQWILYGTAWKEISSNTGVLAVDAEIDSASSTFPANTGSFTRGFYTFTNNYAFLLSTQVVVRTTTTRTYYLNCRTLAITGTHSKTNGTSTFKAVRLD